MKITKATIVKSIKNPKSSYQTLLLVSIAAAAYLYRAFPYFITPQLYAEDGTLWLSEGKFRGIKILILEPYNGFFHFPERLFGFLVGSLPLYWAPVIFACTAWGLFILTTYYLLSKRTQVLKTNYERIFMVLTLCLLANANEFFFNFSNSIFLLGIIGVLIMIAKRPKNRVGDYAEKFAFIMACLCIPFAWIYLPIALLDKYKFKVKNSFFLIASAITALAQAIGYFATNTSRSPVTLMSLFTDKYVFLAFYNQILTPAIRFARIDIPLSEYQGHYEILLVGICLVSLALATYVVLKRSNKQVWLLLFFLAGMTFAAFKSPLIAAPSATEVFKNLSVMVDGNRYFIYGIIAVDLILVKAAYIMFVPKARYVFMGLFIALGLLSSLHYHDFRVEKNWKDYSAEYRHGVDLYYSGQKEVIIPVNPDPWSMGLFNTD